MGRQLGKIFQVAERWGVADVWGGDSMTHRSKSRIKGNSYFLGLLGYLLRYHRHKSCGSDFGARCTFNVTSATPQYCILYSGLSQDRSSTHSCRKDVASTSTHREVFIYERDDST
ncbi:hypothetical protein M413DRAFT_446049 [Hebeloma cylindrosporum]|uniref:Uncharacterized protein n=1 Tax=Hebeloma cylindrosporum TaxID=76867 RepID=A0A0C3C8T3_HEBCY|nr:hypothetical protein M413DRAFT_446049 [Hebeloma cylindrosporum h7]